jgi:hypothetical protein
MSITYAVYHISILLGANHVDFISGIPKLIS